MGQDDFSSEDIKWDKYLILSLIFMYIFMQKTKKTEKKKLYP